MIIGLDLINKCELNITPEKTSLKRWKKNEDEQKFQRIAVPSLKNQIDKFANINFISQSELNEPDLSHLEQKRS